MMMSARGGGKGEYYTANFALIEAAGQGQGQGQSDESTVAQFPFTNQNKKERKGKKSN